MGNVIDYLAQYGDQAFAERAFCDVDDPDFGTVVLF